MFTIMVVRSLLHVVAIFESTEVGDNRQTGGARKPQRCSIGFGVLSESCKSR